jgi:hypothetical protein
MWILLPFAVVSIGRAIVGRRITIYHIASLVAAAVVIGVLTDAGAYRNHFLDLQILAGILVADLWRAAPPSVSDFVRASVLAAVLLGTLASYDNDVLNDTDAAVRSLAGQNQGYDASPLAGVLTPGDRILSEDPYIPVSQGQDPVVLDSFMLRKIVHDHHGWESALIRGINARRFTRIILIRELDPSDTWWRYFSFGAPIISAISKNYRLINVPGYYQTPGHLWVYAPTSRPHKASVSPA